MNVYDFDNTIYNGESGVHFFLFYLKRKPKILLHAPKIVWGIINYKRHKMTLGDVLERYGDVFHKILSTITDYESDIKEFWDLHQHRLKPVYKELQAPDDLIISAGPEVSLREICSRMGVSRYIGTIINEETARFDFVCFRQNKVKAFREQYPNDEIDIFYTDSMDDKPLMDISKQVFIIDRKGKLERIK